MHKSTPPRKKERKKGRKEGGERKKDWTKEESALPVVKILSGFVIDCYFSFNPATNPISSASKLYSDLGSHSFHPYNYHPRQSPDLPSTILSQMLSTDTPALPLPSFLSVLNTEARLIKLK